MIRSPSRVIAVVLAMVCFAPLTSIVAGAADPAPAIHAFGDAPNLAGPTDDAPLAAIAPTASRRGFVTATADGDVSAAGDAQLMGSMHGERLNRAVVAIALTPSGRGYWMAASDGGIFNFGDAAFYGSTGDVRLNQPIVGMAATPSGLGYWLVASDGGVFNFGDAPFVGSTGDMYLNQPIVGVAGTPRGDGYWLVARDGGIFNFGTAPFLGSAGNIVLNQPVIGVAAVRTGDGYWLVARDGGIFNYGSAPYAGSDAGVLPPGVDAVGIAAGGEAGYWIAEAAGTIRLSFAGDVHGEGPVRQLLDRGENPLSEVAADVAGADVAAVNLETPAGSEGVAQHKQFVFNAPTSLLRALAASGIDVVNLANNHALDHGREVLLETIDNARAAGLIPIGAGANSAEAYRPAVLPVRGHHVAFIGLSRVVPVGWAATATKPGVASVYDERAALNAVRSVAAQADVVVVLIHWGVELAKCPGGDIVALADRLRRAGATVIVGGHPHVLQGITNDGAAVTAYSLGNFVWYDDSPPTNATGILDVEIDRASGTHGQLTPALVGGDGRPRLLYGAEADAARARVGPVCAG